MPAINHGLVLWPTHNCLLSILATELGKLDPEDLADCVVVLPTQRLATSLLALLAQAKGALRPPAIWTLDSFVREQVADDPDMLMPAPEMVQEVLINNIIKAGAYVHLHLGHEHELKHFFSELTETGLGESGIDKLIQTIHTDFYHSEDHVQSLIDRYIEMKDVYRKFFGLLQKGGWSNQSLVMAQRAKHLVKSWDQMERLPWKQVYFACFTTIKPYFLPVFQAAARKPNVSIWLSESPDLYGSLHPLADLATGINTPPQIMTITEEKQPRGICHVHVSENILSECATSIAIIERYLELGLQPSQIAVLLTNENLHGKLLRNLIHQRGLSANLAIASPMGQTVFGGWFHLLRQVILGKEDAGDILNFMTHPISLDWLKKQMNIPESGVLDLLKAQLSMEICGQQEFMGFSRIGKAVRDPISKAALTVTAESFQDFLGNGQVQNHLRPLSHWTKDLQSLFNLYGTVDYEVSTDKGMQTSLVVATKLFFEQMLSLKGIADPEMSISEYFRLAADQFNSMDGRSVGYPLEGIQVLSVVEARYVPFQVAIVIGCTEGNFPKALPADNLVDDWLKQRIGLPGWKYVEALEDTTFHLLAARLPHLELTYAKEEKGEPTVRSRFIEAHLSGEKTKPYPWVNRNHVDEYLGGLDKISSNSRLVRAGAAGKFPGPREDFYRYTSATSLKHLITCPYRFLFYKLGISALSLPEENRARIEGQWLHQILDSFFTGRLMGRQVLNPLQVSDLGESLASAWNERLKDFTRQVLPGAELGTPFYYHLTRYAWPKFSQHLAQLANGPEQLRSDSSYKEFKLGEKNSENLAVVKVNVHDASIRGSIDSVDRFGNFHLLTDYKRRSIEATRDVLLGIAPQLGLYALALDSLSNPKDRLPQQHGVIGNWSILGGTWQTHAVGNAARDWALERGIASKRTPAVEDILKNLKNLWAWRLDTLTERVDNFTPDPSPRRWCQYCDFANVCRVHDPQLRQAILAGQALELKISGSNHAEGTNNI
jgi:hypothetical protein